MTMIKRMKHKNASFFGPATGALFLALFAALLAAAALVSCEVGLGESIDVSAPTVSITYPASSSSIGGNLVIRGVANDDKSLDKVVVKVKNAKDEDAEEYTYESKVSGKDWSVVLDKANFPDGTYSADVVVYDGAGRVSGTANRVFDVDNTPPVFCVTKPNSISISDPAAYGRDVVVRGEIADDHTVKQMDIRAFKYDSSSGTAQEITLYKSAFTGFETAGGTEVTIAKYFSESEKPSAGSDDYPLYMNYKAMYEDLGASFGDTVSLYVFPYLTDEAGNVSESAYIQSALKQLLAAACGKDTTCDSFQTAQLKKILNGSYSLDEVDVDTVKAILDGSYDQSALSEKYAYYAHFEQKAAASAIGTEQNVPLTMSLNANNSPMYEFGGYVFDADDPVFAEVASGGTMSVKVSAGLDGNEVIANTLRVFLWECDDTLAIIDSENPSYDSENDFEVTKDGTKVQELSDSETVSNATYKITLPADLEAGAHFVLTASGKDVAENSLYSVAKYAFMVATTGDAPKVDFDDQFFVNAAAIDKTKTANVFKAKITITDKTGNDNAGTLQESGSWVKVTPVLYKGYAKTKAYLSNDDILDNSAETVKFEGAEQIKKDGSTAGLYYVEFPLNQFSLAGTGAADNYTLALHVQAKNKGATSETSAYILWADNKEPVLSVTAPARDDGAAETEPIYIFENDKNVTATTIDGVTSYAYTPRGTWSDLSGSGTAEIWYAWGTIGGSGSNDPAAPALSWTAASGSADGDTTYWTKQAEGFYLADTTVAAGADVSGKYTLSAGSGWTSVSGAPKSVSKANWNQSLDVEDAGGRTLNFVAVDQTGNLTSAVSVKNITFDFAPPAITLPAVNEYYTGSDATDNKYKFDIGVSDASGLRSLAVTAKKYNSAAKAYETVASGKSGYALNTATDKTSASVTLSAAKAASDGAWQFDVEAEDGAERKSQGSFAFTVDTEKPAFVNHYYKNNSEFRKITIGTSGSTEDWHNSENLTIKGKYKELTSGLDRVEYTVTPAGGTALETLNEAIGGATGEEISYSLTPVGFTEGQNSIAIQSFDLAGNASGIATYTIQVDTTAPMISTVWCTYDGENFTTAAGTAMANGKNDMTVYGTLSDSMSGIKSVSLQINGAAVSSSVKYTVDPGLNSGSTDQEKQATWTGAQWSDYADANAAKYTGFRAVISKDSLKKIESGDVELFAVATDKAGNETRQRKFAISLDNEPPKITFLSPEAGAEINGSVTFSGAVDDNSLSAVRAYWSLNGDAEINTGRSANPDHEIASLNGTYSWNISAFAVSSADNETKKIAFVDGTEYSGLAKTVYLKILANDKAANQAVKVQKYVVDPEGDRPIITLTTASLNGMSSSNYVWYDSLKLEGTIEDDDGIEKLEYSIDGGSSWTEVAVSGGAWAAELPSDNDYLVKFRATDKAGTTFTSVKSSGSDIYLSPIIGGKDVTIKSGDTNLYLKVDTNRPEYENLVYKTSDEKEGTYSEGDDPLKLGTVGGQKKFIRLEFDAKDANGVTAASLSLGGTAYAATVGAYDSESNSYPCVISGVDVSGLESGVYSATLSITGSFADDVSTDSLSLTVDNTAPAVTPLSPDENAVYGNVTVYGMVDYAASMQYALSLSKARAPDADDYADIKGAAMTWFVYFDGDSSTETECHDKTLEYYIISKGVEAVNSKGVKVKATAETIADQSFDAIVPIYAWIKALDDVGNVYNEPHLINYDPQGGRPTFTYGSPEKNESRVGGTVKLYGGADDDEGVKAVFLQIISTQHPLSSYTGGTDWGTAVYADGAVTSFNLKANDLDYLKAAGFSVYKMSDYPTVTEWSGSGNPAEYGVFTTFKGTAWNLKINESGEFNPSEGTNELIVCGYAYDGSKFNLPQYRQMLVDADSPIISNIYLKQYSGTEVSASREYIEKMYVKGAWSLEFDLTDQDDVAKVFIGQDDSSADSAKAAALDKKGADNSELDVTVMPSECEYVSAGKYHVTLPLDTASGVGSKYAYVWFADKKGNSTAYAFAVNYDNVAPAVSSVDIDPNVHNSNGYYSVGAKVTEAAVAGKNQSGFDKFVVYFKRGNKIFDPMISKKISGADNPDNWADVSALSMSDDGLYWFSQALEARDADNLNVIKLASANAHIHAGRLVKMGGAIYTILSVSSDGTELTLDGQVEPSFTAAAFAYGNVVDNNKKESGGTASAEEGYGYGYPSDITNDDGDGMVEWANIQGTVCNLSAEINSRNIPDGPIDIYYTAFDAAGNYTSGSVTNSADGAYVSNNAPRLANATVASDYNYDGEYSESESRSYYARSLTDWESAAKELMLGSEDYPFIAAKGAVKVVPEVLGGNGTLAWEWTYPKGGAQTAAAGGTLSADSPTEENAERGIDDIYLSEASLKLADAGTGLYTVSVLDSTDGGAQKAVISVYMKNDVNDAEKPVGKTKRFFWKSLNSNSIYGSSSGVSSQADLQGHIELEDEWTDDDGTAHTFATPKASGKIVIKGTAFDNAGIASLKLTLPGFGLAATEAAACDLNNADTRERWTKAELGTLKDNGYHFAVDTENVRYTNTGHFVPWTLELDTEKYGGGTAPAKTGVKFVLSVVDKNGQGSAETGETMAVYATEEQAAAGKYYAEERFAAADETSAFSAADYDADEFASIAGGEESGTDGVSKYEAAPVSAAYTMDIVPYITTVKTALSAVNDTNGVTDRSALGRYPIYIYTNSTASPRNLATAQADSAETVQIYGFNLKGAKYGSIDLSGTYTAAGSDDYGSGSVALASSSIAGGDFALAVGGVQTLNNSNNNAAKGTYSSKTKIADGGTFSVYKNYINRQPNNENNNNLTDDVAFDVWQLNNMAAAPMFDDVNYPQMKINQSGGKIGFAFSNGSSAFSMPNSTYSWTYWAYDYDRVRYVALNYDPAGYAWTAAAGQDTHSGGGDPFFMETTRYRQYGGDGSGSNHGYADVTSSSAWKLERISVDSNIIQERIQSPSFANTTGGVYLAYYDSYKGEIRYRAGKLNNMNGNNWFDFFTNDGNDSNVGYSRDNVQIVAASSSSGYGTETGAGPYVSIAAVDGKENVANDVVVMVWQDQEAGHLWYSYLKSDPTDWQRKGTIVTASDRRGWSEPVDVFKGKNVSGDYCKIAVDAAGGIHIAAYDSTDSNVWYAYRSKYSDGETQVARVDSYESTGVYLTLDAALDSNGNPAPQIGFYSMASGRPKYAAWNASKGSIAALSNIDGADSNDSYTGKWEVSNIPTTSAVRKSDSETIVEQIVCVGVWKDSEGKLKASTTGNSFCIGSATGGSGGLNANNKGDVYGNGTANAVLSYMYGSASAAYIETAQKKD